MDCAWFGAYEKELTFAANVHSYLPPVQIGEVMRGLSVGTIRASKSDKYTTGSYAAASVGWTELAALNREDVPAQ